MILLADPHPFIVQETDYLSDAEMRAKSQGLAQSRDGPQPIYFVLLSMGRTQISLAAFIVLVVCGID
jgi:hypothetical protein